MTTLSATISQQVCNDMTTYESSDASVDLYQDEPDILEKVKEAIDDVTDQKLSTAIESKHESLANIKGMDLLKEGIYSADLEKTISEMFSVIKNMESQLYKVLRINELLEKEFDEAKQHISNLTKDKASLEKNISRLEEEMPSKREMKIEKDHLIDERNQAHTKLKDLKQRLSKTHNMSLKLLRQVHELSEEKRDTIADIHFLENRLNLSNEKVIQYEKDLKILKGEKLTLITKLSEAETELKETLKDKYQLIKDLKESQKKLDELHKSLSETKQQAKITFYNSLEKNKTSKSDEVQ